MPDTWVDVGDTNCSVDLKSQNAAEHTIPSQSQPNPGNHHAKLLHSGLGGLM